MGETLTVNPVLADTGTLYRVAAFSEMYGTSYSAPGMLIVTAAEATPTPTPTPTPTSSPKPALAESGAAVDPTLGLAGAFLLAGGLILIARRKGSRRSRA